MLALYQATGEREWLDEAVIYNDAMLEQFWDREQAAFFLTGKEHEKLVTPVRDVYDNATPAGSSVAVFNLLKLAILTGNLEYRSIAETNLESMRLPLTRYPNGFGYPLGPPISTWVRSRKLPWWEIRSQARPGGCLKSFMGGSCPTRS